MFLTSIAYFVFAYILLTPLVAMLFQVFLSTSGNSILADQDILLFFLSPLGGICLIVIGAMKLGMIALEQSALMAILAASDEKIRPLEALWFSLTNTWRLLQVTARLIGIFILVSAPFLIVAALVYSSLLTEFDINYYLKQKPPVFLFAVGVGAVLALSLSGVWLRLFSGWCFALPIVLFENVMPQDALKLSRERAVGHRKTIVFAIVVWLLVTGSLSSLVVTLAIGLGRWIIPQTIGSLQLMALSIGASLFIWGAVNFVLTLLSTTSFASLLFHLYKTFGRSDQADPLHLNVAEGSQHILRFQLTPKRILAGGLIGVLLTSLVGAYVVQNIPQEDKVQIMAHRGSSKLAPENTIAAIEQAIEDRADWVEIDVQETADGVVVVFHDSDFMKLAGKNLKLWDATMSDLKDIDIGSWFDPQFQDQRVPTLDQVLALCKGKINVNIELKYYGHDQQLEQRVVEIVESHDMTDNIVLMSLKLDAVKKMKSIRPDWKVGLLMSVAAGNLNKVDADFLAVNAAFIDRSFIKAAHRHSKQVYAWTVNDALTMSTMISRGVDGLITDKPALARSVLQQRAQMTAPERLLLELGGLFGIAPQEYEQ